MCGGGVIKVKDRLWFHTLIQADTSQWRRMWDTILFYVAS